MGCEYLESLFFVVWRPGFLLFVGNLYPVFLVNRMERIQNLCNNLLVVSGSVIKQQPNAQIYLQM